MAEELANAKWCFNWKGKNNLIFEDFVEFVVFPIPIASSCSPSDFPPFDGELNYYGTE
jgi:hypothetical protein